jgi:hypothetical protein
MAVIYPGPPEIDGASGTNDGHNSATVVHIDKGESTVVVRRGPMKVHYNNCRLRTQPQISGQIYPWQIRITTYLSPRPHRYTLAINAVCQVPQTNKCRRIPENVLVQIIPASFHSSLSHVNIGIISEREILYE